MFSQNIFFFYISASRTRIGYKTESAGSAAETSQTSMQVKHENPEHPGTVQPKPRNPLIKLLRPPPVLQFASPELQNNYSLVKVAVLWNPENLQYASEDLRALEEMTEIALNSPYGLASGLPCQDEEKPESLLAKDPPELQDDADRVLHALDRSGWELQFASKEVREDELVVAWACAPRSLRVIPDEHVKGYLREWKRLNFIHFRNQKKWRDAINDEDKRAAEKTHKDCREAMCELKTYYPELGEITLTMIDVLYPGEVDMPVGIPDGM